MKPPNIFSFATKELSQDAFICWLLAWADKAYEKNDLHLSGLAFMQAILKKYDFENQPIIETIEIKRQCKKIDILCLLNVSLKDLGNKKQPPENSYAIIIEDKVGSSQHSGQLKRYTETIKSLGFEDEQILRVYLKTKDQIHYKEIEAQSYKPFTRSDFLTVLESYKGENQILIEFRTYWQKVEDETRSYHSLENPNAWRGFYKALNDAEDIGLKQGALGTSSFSTNLASPTYSGLFAQDKQGCRLYVQLCKNTLNLKIKVTNKLEIKQLRDKWLKLVNAKDLGNGLVIKKPKRLGNGKAMVIGTLENYIAYEDNKVSLQKTIKNLRGIEQFISEFETSCE